MAGKSCELAKETRNRKIDIAAVQKVNWKGSKARDLSNGYKLFYHGTDARRNEVGIIVALQHRMLIADTRFPKPKPPKIDRTQTARIKW